MWWVLWEYYFQRQQKICTLTFLRRISEIFENALWTTKKSTLHFVSHLNSSSFHFNLPESEKSGIIMALLWSIARDPSTRPVSTTLYCLARLSVITDSTACLSTNSQTTEIVCEMERRIIYHLKNPIRNVGTIRDDKICARVYCTRL